MLAKSHSKDSTAKVLEHQSYGSDPTSVRKTDHYKAEYVQSFVEQLRKLPACFVDVDQLHATRLSCTTCLVKLCSRGSGRGGGPGAYPLKTPCGLGATGKILIITNT
jgi:hypothetical protein